jgi:hypothetical protein
MTDLLAQQTADLALLAAIGLDSDDCTCPEPMWWIDEDDHGRPIKACEKCGKWQSFADAVREFEDVQAEEADRQWKR